MSTSSARVLVVEDDPALHRFYGRFFEGRHGDEFSWTLAADAEAAVKALRKEAFQLIVMDWMLPGLVSGLAVVRALRAQGATRGLGIIVVTGRSDAADAVTALDSGADDYLAKPFGEEELLARLRAVRRRVRAT